MAVHVQTSGNDQAEFERRAETLTQWARENLSFEQAISMFALHKAVADSLTELLDESNADHERTIKLLRQSNFRGLKTALTLKEAAKDISKVPRWITQAMITGIEISKIKASSRGRVAADIRHSKPGNSREKQDAIRAAWASGKYSSRDLCAEQECAALNMAPGTARRALRNTPEPPRRCIA